MGWRGVLDACCRRMLRTSIYLRSDGLCIHAVLRNDLIHEVDVVVYVCVNVCLSVAV